jgi:isochorismate synthase
LNTSSSSPHVLSTIPAGWSFACWQLPGESHIRVMASPTSRVIQGVPDDILASPGYLIVPFDVADEKTVWIPATVTHQCHVDDFTPDRLDLSMPDVPCVDASEEMSASFHHQCVDELVKNIRRHHLSKVILSRRASFGFDVQHARSAFMRLCKIYHQACVFWFYTSETGMWMGATPELLLSGDHTRLTTVALAGTRSSATPVSTPWNHKEIEEQGMVTRFIHDVLRRQGVADVTTQGPFTANAGGVSHLKTEFSFAADPSMHSLGQLLMDLHPTPAVCGLPKQQALEAIRAIEPHSRGYYGGFQGQTGTQPSAYYVSIRCMKMHNANVTLYVGGGITASSVAADEWHETELKAQTLLSVLKNM